MTCRKLLGWFLTSATILLGAQSVNAADGDAVKPTVVLMKTNLGEIAVELDREKAPATVDNFLRYVNEGFYNGTIFHRVIAGFMIQGGGFDADYDQKETHSAVKNEADNGLKNDVGTIAMARTSDPQSATAQFFINVNNNDFLNFRSRDSNGWGYAVFGKVVNGMATLDAIKAVPTGSQGPFGQDVPLTPVVIESIAVSP